MLLTVAITYDAFNATYCTPSPPIPGCHVCVTWLIRMCDVTHSYVWQDSFICVTWIIHMCVMTHTFTCVTWLIHMCDMTHSHVWQDSFTCVPWLMHMCDTHSYVPWRDTLTIKLYVSFAKEPYKRDDILQKRPVILSILLPVATP